MRVERARRPHESGFGRVRGARRAVREVRIARVSPSPPHLETPAMNPTRHHSAPTGPADGPAHGSSADSGLADGNPVASSAAVRRALWVVGPVAVAVPVSVVLVLARAGGDWIGAVWLAAVLWAIGASFVQALWRGLRHGDWAAFASCDLPRNDDDFDYTTRSGEFVFMKIHADHEALMRDGDRFLQNHDHDDSRT